MHISIQYWVEKWKKLISLIYLFLNIFPNNRKGVLKIVWQRIIEQKDKETSL